MAFVYHYIGPYAYGANFARGAVGGEEEHTLTKAELPNVSIELGAEAIKSNEASMRLTDAGEKWYRVGNAGIDYTKPLGTGQAHNNMPPYLAQNIIVRAL